MKKYPTLPPVFACTLVPKNPFHSFHQVPHQGLIEPNPALGETTLLISNRRGELTSVINLGHADGCFASVLVSNAILGQATQSYELAQSVDLQSYLEILRNRRSDEALYERGCFYQSVEDLIGEASDYGE